MEKRYKPITSLNLQNIPQLSSLSKEDRFAMQVVSSVLPFRSNNYVVDELIDWSNIPDDPIFRLTFPQREMLSNRHFRQMADSILREDPKAERLHVANQIRMELNPHPAGQIDQNMPWFEGQKLTGIQHKYRETVLFFPSQGQTCHAYCTFCFRWPQFVGLEGLKFAANESGKLVEYLQAHPQVTDVLFTGGDPMIMKSSLLAAYLEPILEARIPHLRTIRIGSKSLGFWPYKFTSDPDAEQTLSLFRKVRDSGLNLSFMAHFSHPRELGTSAVRAAANRILETGAQIRTQSPIMRHINNKARIWSDMWRKQVDMGMIPYYMFIARDTGAQHYFALPLVECWKIFQQAYSGVSGICRTVRGPSMSTGPGKVQILGVSEVAGERAMALRFLQARCASWVQRPFFARYDPHAIWLSDLKPAFGASKFFFEESLREKPDRPYFSQSPIHLPRHLPSVN